MEEMLNTDKSYVTNSLSDLKRVSSNTEWLFHINKI